MWGLPSALLQFPAAKAHESAVRLCGLVYFFAFLGNVVDGPVLWMLEPPDGGWEAGSLLRLNQIALVPALLTFFRPRWWPCLAICWPLWHTTQENGGKWFYFGWDSMMDEIGFLTLLLAVTLSFYDEQVHELPDTESDSNTVETGDSQESEPVMAAPAESEGSRGPMPLASTEVPGSCPKTFAGKSASDSTLRSRARLEAASVFAACCAPANKTPEAPDASEPSKNPSPSVLAVSCSSLISRKVLWKSWCALWGVTTEAAKGPLEPCEPAAAWSRVLAELSLTLAGFRLFVAAGLMKMRVGSECWKDHTCLFDHYETQPMPNAAAWYFHNLTPHWMLRVMQWFAIDFAECFVPYLLLAFFFSMGPLGLLHRKLRQSEFWYARLPALVPVRFIGASVIIIFVLGMFVGGNYSFLHPLAIVSLVASMGTAHGVPVVIRDDRGSPMWRAVATVKEWYRRIAPWGVIVLLVFAFLPSLRAYAWIFTGSEALQPPLGWLMTAPFVQHAEAMNLGIPYNHHAYFAGAVHKRNEMVLMGNAGNGWVELDIPYKVGRVDRRPRQTSPLHRRFAWQWWFLGLGDDPSWLYKFMERLCARDPVAWAAVEQSPLHERKEELRHVSAELYRYHFSKPGVSEWWVRKKVHSYVSTRVDVPCG